MHKLKLFLTLLSSTTVIFCSAYFGPKAFGSGIGDYASNAHSPALKTQQKQPLIKATNVKKQEMAISTASISISDLPDDLRMLTKNYPKIELPAEASFSLMHFLTTEKLDHSLSSESLSVFGTLLYQAILPTNFSIVERNTSRELPRYAKLGFESKVSAEQNFDLVFYNPNQTKYTLKLREESGVLYVDLIGEPLSEQYKIRLSGVQILKPKTIVQYSPLLTPGQKKVVAAGANGQVVQVYKDTFQNDELINSQLVSEDYYPPVYRVEIYPLNLPEEQQSAEQSTSGGAQSQNTDVNQPQATAASNSQSNVASETPMSTESDLWGKPNEQSK